MKNYIFLLALISSSAYSATGDGSSGTPGSAQQSDSSKPAFCLISIKATGDGSSGSSGNSTGDGSSGSSGNATGDGSSGGKATGDGSSGDKFFQLFCPSK